MKLVSNHVTKKQLVSSRPEQTIDNGLQMIVLKLSMLSYIFFGGARVQFVVWAGESVGSPPSWMTPRNRLSERFVKTQRGSLENGNSKEFEHANGAALVQVLAAKIQDIICVSQMQMNELKELHIHFFPGHQQGSACYGADVFEIGT